MIAVLRLTERYSAPPWVARGSRTGTGGYYCVKRRPWVAAILGTDSVYGLARDFVGYYRDYSTASRRGDFATLCFPLRGGRFYEVAEVGSWKKGHVRRFVRSMAGDVVPVTKEEVMEWAVAIGEPR